MSPLTAKQQSFITMMKTNDELARKGFRLLLQRNDYPHFLDPLQEAGFFAPEANPAPVSGEQENTVWIPFWAPLDYFKAVAQYAGTHDDLPLAAKVMNLVRTVSAWHDREGKPRRNYHTGRIFAEVLGLVPTNAISLNDIDLVKEWLNDPYERMFIADALDRGALPRFLNSANPEDWEKAARLIYHVTAINWRKDADESEPNPSSVVDDYALGALLKNHAKQIGEKAGEHAAETMLDRVREVFSTPTRRDYSTAFRPAVEDDVQNYQWRSVENRVVEGLRDVLLGWAGKDPKNAGAVIQSMLTDNLQIIRRIGIYVLAQQWASMRELYIGIARASLFDNGHIHELYHLLQDQFAEMGPEEQAATFKAIEELPRPQYGDDPDRLRRYNQYRWISAISAKGFVPADKLFAELDADLTVGKLSDHPDFDSFISSSVGPGATPYSPEELTALAKAHVLVDKLNAFKPRDDWRGPSTGGLTSALEAGALTNPDVFLDSLSQLLIAKPVYQHAVINGLKQAWEAKTSVNWLQGWEQLASFFEQLSKDQQFWDRAQDIYQHWVVTAMADCLRAGTEKDEHAYDASLLPRTQVIISRLLEHEPGEETAADDAMFQAMNTPRGRIVEALYSHALRAARVSDQKEGSHGKTWDAIRPLFETELAKCQNRNFEFSTLSANYLPQLQYLNNGWTVERVNQIFPPAYEANTVCALDGLAYAAFTRPLYEVLAGSGVIDRALTLELKGRSAREKLLERIAAAYLWGLEAIDGARFMGLFENGTIKDFDVLIRLFWMVRNDNLAPEQREGILAFWDRSLAWAQRQPQVPARLLSMSGLLATHIRTLGVRERRFLETVAPHVHVGHETYEFLAELLRLAPQDPPAITKILQLMIDAHPPDYDYQDRLRSLLEFLAAHGQRDTVILLSNQLRHLEGVQALFKRLTEH
jgi:hypothetical protein